MLLAQRPRGAAHVSPPPQPVCDGSVTKGRLRGGGGGGRRRRRRCGGGAKSQPPPSFHLIHIAETDVA